VKGGEHRVSKSGTSLAPIYADSLSSYEAFVEMVVTEARCVPMIQKIKESGVKIVERKHLGQALKWMNDDIVKEESDVMISNNLDVKKVAPLITVYTKQWFFKNEYKFDEL